MYIIRYITYLRNRRVFPGRSLGLLSFLALEFGDTVLFGSVVMSFALDEHPCPSTVSQTQKRLVSHHCFLFFSLYSLENRYLPLVLDSRRNSHTKFHSSTKRPI